MTLQVGSWHEVERAEGGRTPCVIIAIRPACYGDPVSFVIRTLAGSVHAVPAAALLCCGGVA